MLLLHHNTVYVQSVKKKFKPLTRLQHLCLHVTMGCKDGLHCVPICLGNADWVG
jgi:hypothetical protein